MPTSAELKQLAQARLNEAKSLRAAGHFACAWYIGGYVCELALKACVCKTLRLVMYPDSELRVFRTHSYGELLLLSGLRGELEIAKQRTGFDQNWAIVTTWGPDQRYQTYQTESKVSELISALEDPEEGVLPWLIQWW